MNGARFSRRKLVSTAGAGALALLLGESEFANAVAAQKRVLVVGIDISDTNALDPAKQYVYSAPMTVMATYEALATMVPGDYEAARPQLATKWERVDDGNAWLFHLREGVKFQSGNPLTAQDVKFSFDRVKNLKEDPSSLVTNFKSTDVVNARTVKITMVNKAEPLLNVLVSPTVVITDSKTVAAHGGVSGPNAAQQDKAVNWLNQHSAGTGPYTLTQWTRNSQIVLERNPRYWRTPGAFQRVIIKHIPESETQVLALKRGDIDAALNLTPKQVDGLKGEGGIQIVQARSLDYVYMTLTNSADLNPALAKQEARQAIAYAIDYDGLVNGLLQGFAVRPANFIPIGVGGITERLTKESGYRLDPARAKELLQKAGLSNGFSFKLSYGNASIVGTTYELIAEKIQSDLAKVGITANLNPMDQALMRTKYTHGELESVITFWNPDFPDPWDWAEPAVHRVAKRVHWAVPESDMTLFARAAGATAKAEADAAYIQLEKNLVQQANYIILFQPTYRYAIRTSITGWVPTAAGWLVDLYGVRPA